MHKDNQAVVFDNIVANYIASNIPNIYFRNVITFDDNSAYFRFVFYN
jgi:hypothetical protein